MTKVQLHHVQINVADVPAAVEFYLALGTRARSDMPDVDVEVTWLDAGDGQIHLVKGEVPADFGQHFALEVDDIDSVVSRLRSSGVQVEDPVSLGDWLGRQTSFQDPWGNRIELRSRPK